MEGRTLVLVLASVVLSAAQSPGFGPCPKTQPQKDLDLDRYLGKWYEVYKLPNIFESKQDCVTANYSMKANGHIKVLNSGVKDGKRVYAIGDVYRPDDSKPAELSVKFAEGTPYGPYWVLETDYNYSLVFSCEQLGGLAHANFIWILSRTPSLDPAIKDRLFKKLQNDGIGTSRITKTNTSGC